MLIVKIGGGEKLNLPAIIKDLSTLTEPFMIIHGANALRDEVAEKMGFEKTILTSLSGYTSVFSDENALDAILMAYSGLRNKRLVELCQQNDINAVGLTGLDGRIVQGRRNKGIRVMENGKKMLKRDFSGKPAEVNSDLLRMLIDNGYVPVLTIPICDENGNAINSENDDIVCKLQLGLDADTVIQLIEAPGFMEDINDPDSVHTRLSYGELEAREQQVEGRMKRKMHALNKLAKGNVKKIIICDGRGDNPITDALNGGGTWIQP
ncbi:MAG: [LysW]-aminoadipate kinase [Gammaproteobacteria bacterium]|nr:[LysW]-aminoadipate kinase [Gammaproteobacteria bacterium]